MMKSDVQHRKTRKFKQRKGKKQTLKIGGMSKKKQEEVTKFMQETEERSSQSLTPIETEKLKRVITDALTHDRGDPNDKLALGSRAPRVGYFEDRKKSALAELERALPPEKFTPANIEILKTKLTELMDKDHENEKKIFVQFGLTLFKVEKNY